MIYLKLKTTRREDDDGGSYTRWTKGCCYIEAIEYSMDGAVKQTRGQVSDELRLALESGDVVMCYNAQDTRLALKSVGVDVPIKQFKCLQVLLSVSGLQDSVQLAIECITGKQVQNNLASEIELWKLLEQVMLSDEEWQHYWNSEVINARGLPVDVEFVKRCYDISYNHDEDVRSVIRRTAGSKLTSRRDLKLWLVNKGVQLKTDSRQELVQAMQASDKKDVRTVLKMMEELMMTGFARFRSLLKATDNSRIRGCFKFAGAGRTWRFSGAGTGFQPQNIPNPVFDVEEARQAIKELDLDTISSLYPSAADVISSVMRSCIHAPAGKKLVSIDYKAIEISVIAAITGCNALLEILRHDADPYKTFAAQKTGVKVVDVDAELRKFFKPVVLAGGFGQSASGLVKYAANMGIVLSEEQAQDQIDFYRGMCHEVVDQWMKFQSAAKSAVNGYPKACGYAECVSFERSKHWLHMRLPSGRSCNFFDPKIENGRLTFLGINSKNNKFERMELWGAWLVQIATQSIARDLLVHGIEKTINHHDFEVVGSIHDELLALVDEGKTDRSNSFKLLFCMKPAWSQSIELYVDGSVTIGDYYQ